MGLSSPDWHGAEADIMSMSLVWPAWAGCVLFWCRGMGSIYRTIFTLPSGRIWLAVMLDGLAFGVIGRIINSALVGHARHPICISCGGTSGVKSVVFLLYFIVFLGQSPVGLRFAWWQKPGGPKICVEGLAPPAGYFHPPAQPGVTSAAK